MKKRNKIIAAVIILLTASYFVFKKAKTVNLNPKHQIGEKIDSLNNVYVYYNGGIDHVLERNKTADGYNLGLKYQCVEFVKRYYYQHYKHKMPDSYGHAKDFFDAEVADGLMNKKRNLLQFRNPSNSMPEVGDLMIFDGHAGNPYGHVAVVSQVTAFGVELIQQNAGPFANSRVKYGISRVNDGYFIEHEGTLGWLRKK